MACLPAVHSRAAAEPKLPYLYPSHPKPEQCILLLRHAQHGGQYVGSTGCDREHSSFPATGSPADLHCFDLLLQCRSKFLPFCFFPGVFPNTSENRPKSHVAPRCRVSVRSWFVVEPIPAQPTDVSYSGRDCSDRVRGVTIPYFLIFRANNLRSTPSNRAAAL